MRHSSISAPSPGLNRWLAQIDQAMQKHDMASASRLAASALDLGYVHPALFNLRAQASRLDGRLEEALADLARAHDLNNRSAWTLADMADCLNALSRYPKALAAADAAIAADRKYSKAWFQKGLAHQALREIGRARTAYLMAVQLEPSLADAHARLANIAAEQADHVEARRFAMTALAAAPGHPMALLALIAADMGEDKLADAERRLVAFLARADLPAPMRAVAISQLGDLRDAQGKVDEAFAAYADSRAIWAGFHVPQFESRELGCNQVLRLGAMLAGAPAQMGPGAGLGLSR